MKDFERHVGSVRVLDLVHDSGCSAYDCEFVALALMLEIPLVTEDKRILRSFPDTAVDMARLVDVLGQ